MHNNIQWILVHHSGGTLSDPLADTSNHTFEQVNAWHRQDPNIWLGHLSKLGYAIGYHYFIEKDGTLKQGRLDTEEGAHCKGYNLQSLGICLAGNFDTTAPTQAQIDTLRSFLRAKTALWSVPVTNVIPHRHFANKSCYGSKLNDSWAADLIRPPITPTPCQAEKDAITDLSTRLNWFEKLTGWSIKKI